MRALLKPVLLTTLIVVSMFISVSTYAETLMGQVLDRRGVPVPGMEVRLYHPGPGESRPRFTDNNGVFFFDFVPRVNGSYDIEYYWKGRLIYRGRVTVIGNVRLQPINL